jgi:hypothetical protein
LASLFFALPERAIKRKILLAGLAAVTEDGDAPSEL